MASPPLPFLTPEQYLELEPEAEFKSEYWRGEMFAMAGATRPHNLITTNTARLAGVELRSKPCEIYSSDMRIRTAQAGLYTYPDVVIVCADTQFLDKRQDTLLNPTVIVEVLSPSTEAYDAAASLNATARSNPCANTSSSPKTACRPISTPAKTTVHGCCAPLANPKTSSNWNRLAADSASPNAMKKWNSRLNRPSGLYWTHSRSFLW